MFFPVMDYKVINYTLYASNGNPSRLIYTTEYPCMLFVEVPPGQLAGYNGRQSCYFDINYTGNNPNPVRTYLWGYVISSFSSTPTGNGTPVGYCPRAGVGIIFNTGDDDYGGSVKLHVMRLP